MTNFTMDPDWLVFDADPTRPSYDLPEGSVDAHCHVFGPGDKFPYAPERKYTPCDAGRDQLFALRDFLTFERTVIVQATCHGNDNSAMLDALRASEDKARGVASIEPSVNDDELAEMHEAGVRGVRFNYVRRLVDPEPDEYYRRVIERIAPLGWHVVIYFEAKDLAEKWDFFTSLPTTVVVDHLGRPDISKPINGAEFQLYLRLMEEHPQYWSKVTGAERLSRVGPPSYRDFVPFARRVVESFPDRVLWGTDWPHPNLKSHMPDDGVLVNLIPQLAPSEGLRRKLLVDNPRRLYWGIRP